MAFIPELGNFGRSVIVLLQIVLLEGPQLHIECAVEID